MSHPRIEWLCSNCHAPYNRELIEGSLMAAAQRLSATYSLQDLVCTKCRGVRKRERERERERERREFTSVAEDHVTVI